MRNFYQKFVILIKFWNNKQFESYGMLHYEIFQQTNSMEGNATINSFTKLNKTKNIESLIICRHKRKLIVEPNRTLTIVRGSHIFMHLSGKKGN